MAFVTKSQAYGFLFGKGLSNFDPNVKPTRCNVVQFWIWHFDKARGSSRIMSKSAKENVVKDVVHSLVALPVYKSAHLLSEKSIRNNVDILINKVEKLDTRRRQNDTSEATLKWIQDTTTSMACDQVFNVEICQ